MIDAGLLKDAIASEWTKLRSVRSTYWTIFAAVIFGVGLSCAITAGTAHAYSHFDVKDRLLFDPTANSMSGLFFAQLAFGVFGVMMMSAEYSTGLVRTTMAAVPQRGYVLAAKTIMAGVVSTVVGLAIAFVSFSLGQLIFSTKHLNVSLSDPHVLRAVFGAGLYIGVMVLLALGLATIIRHTAGGITSVVAIFFVIPIVAQLLPDSLQHDIARFLPAEAGSAMFTVVPQGRSSLSAAPGFLIYLGWAALFLAIGWYMLRSRDV
jgi:hypothetical protein